MKEKLISWGTESVHPDLPDLMAKRDPTQKTILKEAAPPAPAVAPSSPKSISRMPFSIAWVSCLLAATTIFAYWPSLKSDFVYDARKEILEEGFITSLGNLPAVLSLKVLGTNLLLGDRPGQLVYLMLIAAVCGREPWGYHLCGNFLHAANVALLFVLLLRLVMTEWPGLARSDLWKVQLSAAAAALIFALHPLAVEAVAAVNYSSDLLVTFFTLLALLAATAFQPDLRSAWRTEIAGALCALAAVTCKESGVAAAFLLIVYWFLFRRRETKGPWLLFLSAAATVTIAFLAARFLLAPASPNHLSYLGGSFFRVFLIQPRLWVFMMGRLVWPAGLSADYTLENLGGLSTPLAAAILVVVVGLQIWLARKSRLGALGVAVYWLGLATVSNFIPLNRILADRFYYLPLAGVAMQLLALLLMALRSRLGFWLTLAPCLAAIVPLTLLTLRREEVFASDFSLWSDTVQVSPFSSAAHNGLGLALFHQGRADEAISQFVKALELDPNWFQPNYNLGVVFAQKGQFDEAVTYFNKSLANYPNLPDARNNLGVILLRKGRVDEAIPQFVKALEINPYYAMAHGNLGMALFQKGRVDEAIVQFQKAVEINPNYAEAHTNLGIALFQKGEADEAIAQFQEVVRLNPNDRDAQDNLTKAEAMARQGAGQKK